MLNQDNILFSASIGVMAISVFNLLRHARTDRLIATSMETIADVLQTEHHLEQEVDSLAGALKKKTIVAD